MCNRFYAAPKRSILNKVIKKNQPEYISELKISDLSQQLPKVEESQLQEFLSSQNNKFRITNLTADYFLEKASLSKEIYITKGQHCCEKINEF